MKDGHSHKCECQHKRVKFCVKCSVVHCLECKIEWVCQPCTKPHFHASAYPWHWTNHRINLCQDSASTFTVTQPQVTPGTSIKPLDVTPEITCSH